MFYKGVRLHKVGACQSGFCFTWYIRYIKIVIIASFDQNVFTLPFKHQNILVFWSSCVKNFFHLKGESLSWPLVINLWEPSILYLIHLSLFFFSYFVLFMCLFVCLFFCYNFFVPQLWRKNNMVIKFFLLLLFCLVSIIQTECGLFKKLG